MTTFFQITNYGFAVLKVFLFFVLLHAVYPDFKYRYACVISLIAAPFYIALAPICITIGSPVPILLYIAALFGGSCILVRKDFFTLITLSAFYVLIIGCLELCYITWMMNYSYYGGRYLYLVTAYYKQPRFFYSLKTKACEIILILLLCAVIRRIHKEQMKLWKLLPVTAAGYIFLGFMIRNTFRNYFSVPPLWIILIVFLILLFLILLFELDLRNRQHLAEKEALSSRLLEEKYQNLNELYSQNARLYHDINNHLASLYHLLEEQKISEAKDYIATMRKPVQILKKTRWTGDDVLDAVLNDKIHQMKQLDIAYEIQADFPDHTGIEAADLCTVLANLLDNAMEATEKLPEQTAPVKIRIQSIKKFVLVEISNPSREVQFTDQGIPKKTRKSSFHGWGLHNVTQTVEKYNGTIQFEYGNGIFTASAILFFPQEKRD